MAYEYEDVIVWVNVDFLSGKGIYQLYIDGILVATKPAGGATVFRYTLSEGPHHFEILAIDFITSQTALVASNWVYQSATNGVIAFVSKPNKPILGRGGQIIGELQKTPPPSWCEADAEFKAFRECVRTVTQIFSSMGACVVSDNYDATTGGYKPIELNNGFDPFSIVDKYKIGSKVHIEVRGYDLNGNNVGVQVQDFTAGQPPWPGPLTVDLDYSYNISSVFKEGGVVNVVTPDTIDNVTYALPNGVTFSNFKFGLENPIVLAPNRQSDAFDYFDGLSDGTAINYLQLNESLNIVGDGTRLPITMTIIP